MPKRTVSLKDISLACGVSIATVSKALNDHSDIGRETKEKVREVARQLGYQPNAAAQALKTNKSNSIGVLFVDEANSGLTHDFFANILDSFKRKAEEEGFDITFINGDRSLNNKMSYLSRARYRGFDGVVIACVDFSDPEVDELIRSNIPVVTIDHSFYNRISIVSDNITGIRELVNYVYDQGHRKIAYVYGQQNTAVTQSRVASFYRTLQDLEVPIRDEYMIESSYRDIEDAYRATNQLLDLPDPPTCILYPDDYATFGGYNAIRERGLSVPEDVSVAGYDGIDLANRISPRLTTVVQDTKSIGRLAASKLIDLINNPKGTLIEQITVPIILEEGESVKRIVP